MTDERSAAGNALLNTSAILKDVGVHYGQSIGDLGCGSGAHFTMQAAKMVGERGKVYAVDVVKGILPSVASKAKMEGLGNVETVWTDLERYGAAAKQMKDESLDMALLINILFQSKKIPDIFKEATRMVKKGGKVIVIDWKTSEAPIGPVVGDRVPEETILQAAHAAGLQEERTFEPGKFHYGFVFTK